MDIFTKLEIISELMDFYEELSFTKQNENKWEEKIYKMIEEIIKND